MNQVKAGRKTNPREPRYIQIDAEIARYKDGLTQFMAQDPTPGLDALLVVAWQFALNVKSYPCTSVKSK